MRVSWYWNPWEVSGRSPSAMAADVEAAAQRGVGRYWMPQHPFGPEAMTVLAASARVTAGMHIGVGVVPVPNRHPMALAAAARTTAALLPGTFELGLGLSVPRFVSNMWGLELARPVAWLAEYLDVLLPLLAGEPVAHDGEFFQVRGMVDTGPGPVPRVVLAAMGEQMLRLAGRRGLATFTFMTTPDVLASHTVEHLRRAAADAGLGQPEVIAGAWVCVTDDRRQALDRAAQLFLNYDRHPTGASLLDLAGLNRAAETAIVGDEVEVIEALTKYRDAGATEVAVSPFGAPGDLDRTAEFVAEHQLI